MQQDNFIVMDGGMGQELTRRLNVKGGLWSAQALVDAPDTVADVHREFIDAGARVILTNTYSTIPSYFAKAGITDKYLDYARLAGEIARKVADEESQARQIDVRVLASIPPLDESYRHDLVPADDVSRVIYSELVKVLTPFVDGFVCETMSCIRESINAVASVRKTNADLPCWIAWTLHESAGGGLRSGESIAQAYQALSPFDVQAYLFSCTSLEAITAAMPEMRALTQKPIGAYPNRLAIPDGWTLDNPVPAGLRDMSEDEFVAAANDWRQAGASIVGGCCGVGPDLIAALASSLASSRGAL